MKFIREMIARRSAESHEELDEYEDEDFGEEWDEAENLEKLERARSRLVEAASAEDEDDADEWAEDDEFETVAEDDSEYGDEDLVDDFVEEDDEDREYDDDFDFEDEDEDEFEDAAFAEEGEVDTEAEPVFEDPEDLDEDEAVADPVAQDDDQDAQDLALAEAAELEEFEAAHEMADAPDAHEQFADVPEESGEEALPELSMEDIERAMKLRKKIWHKVPNDEQLLNNPEQENRAPTSVAAPVAATASQAESPKSRPHTRPRSEDPTRPVSVVVDQVQPDDVRPTRDLVEPEATTVNSADDAAPASAETEVAANSSTSDDTPMIESLMAAAANVADATAAIPDVVVEVPAPAEGRAGRRAGRVKTRLIGFQGVGDTEGDVFANSEQVEPASRHEMFPVGWIIVEAGPGRGASFTLKPGVSMIGRGDDQAICLDFGDNAISREGHASVAFDDEGNRFYLGHGGKSNIVRLNDAPVLSTIEMNDGDVIRIGETTLRFKALCNSDFNWSESNDGGSTDHAAIA